MEIKYTKKRRPDMLNRILPGQTFSRVHRVIVSTALFDANPIVMISADQDNKIIFRNCNCNSKKLKVKC